MYIPLRQWQTSQPASLKAVAMYSCIETHMTNAGEAHRAALGHLGKNGAINSTLRARKCHVMLSVLAKHLASHSTPDSSPAGSE
jgi:hypothetical protein